MYYVPIYVLVRIMLTSRMFACKLFFFFFFSGRRRHTRFKCDWNSDVCSSDLGEVAHHIAEVLLGMEGRGTSQNVRAHVPLAEMFGYATELRSMTSGRATYSMEFSHYAEMPGKIGRASCRERV